MCLLLYVLISQFNVILHSSDVVESIIMMIKCEKNPVGTWSKSTRKVRQAEPHFVLEAE